jgi:hypothetical protein
MPAVATKLRHARLGLCELVRVEGADWIVATQNGVHYRFPPEKRGEFREEALPPPANFEPFASSASGQLAGAVASDNLSNKSRETESARVLWHKKAVGECCSESLVDAKIARRAIESLRIGLPAFGVDMRHLAVGFEQTEEIITAFLDSVSGSGSGLMVNGAYGQGKTFLLTILEENAVSRGFVTARAEIESLECPFNKPQKVYRTLVKDLRIPGEPKMGIENLVCMVNRQFHPLCGSDPDARFSFFAKQLGCLPLAWFLSDPEGDTKPRLLKLLRGEADGSIGYARLSHCRPSLGNRLWPRFYARNQADLATYLLSGVSRLARLLGFQGLVVILDEAEKLFQLRGYDKECGTNLLGGLLWAASAKVGRRSRINEPPVLFHSAASPYSSDRGECPGVPFTTEDAAHLGVAVAMTPGHEQSPTDMLAHVGTFVVADAPALTHDRLVMYCSALCPYYASAFGLLKPNKTDLQSIAAEAIQLWQAAGNMNTRSGVQAVIAAFDHWRNRV